MTRFLMAVFCLLISFAANAASMCIPKSTYIAVLVPDKNGTSSDYDSDGNWTAIFDYTTAGLNSVTSSVVVGISSCNEIPGTVNAAADGISASASDTGNYCWCGMTKPLISKWVFVGEYASDEVCAQSCAARCANYAETSTTFRTEIYGNIFW